MVYLKLLLVKFSLVATGNGLLADLVEVDGPGCINHHGLRADLNAGFKMCPGRQLGRVVAAEVDGPGCINHNGQPQWPCHVIPGKDGVFKISFMHQNRNALDYIESSIHANVKLRFSFIEQSIPIAGEANQNACPHTFYHSVIGPYYGCPIQQNVVHTIQKTVTVPNSVRFAQSNLNIEFKLTDRRGNNIICFMAPMVIP